MTLLTQMSDVDAWVPLPNESKSFVISTEAKYRFDFIVFNPLNAELNPTYHFLALLGAHHILHVSRIRVKHDAID